jgi:predicted aldo/keto reductase-like oxidoreductase
MRHNSSRRAFLASTIALPVAATAPAAGATLSYRTLGNTGLKVTTLGFGCMLVSDASVVARALDMGINFFDTARSYQSGNNERMVGSVLKGRRKDIILETKSAAKTKDAALQDLETSLKELGTDYVDIWHLHNRNVPADINDDVLEAQRLAKQQGKIRFAGISMHLTMQEMIPHVVKLKQTDVILSAYNFSMPPDMEVEKNLALARKAGIGIIAMKVMAGGFARIQRGDRLYSNSAQSLTEKLKQPGAMLSALKWAIRNQDVATAIVGITDADQLEENFAAMSAPYNDADGKRLAAQLDLIRPLYCRMCGECSGKCPQGLPVGDMLRILSYADGYGQFPLARQRFRELPEDVTRVRCGDCTACPIRCPNGVNVVARLERAQEWLA